MSAATATGHDLEVLLRVVAVRQLLNNYAGGAFIPTTGALANLAGVLVWASRHQWAADAERRAP